jgi:general secretion pathway protein A
MYREFYGFSEEPFALSPDPKFLFPARSHFEALSSMMSAIKERKGIVVVTGEVGLGKTLLIYALLNDLSEKIKTAFIFNPGLDLKSLFKNILQDLDVPFGRRQDDLLSLMTRFREYLNERLSRDETVAVVIDEAQNLDEEVLAALGRFCSPDIPASRALQVLLVGHPELETKLNGEKFHLLRKRMNVRCRISPLTRQEGREYIEHRLRLAGREMSEVFTSGVADMIWEFAQGVPRVINLVCDRAFLNGFVKSSPHITAKIAREAMKDLEHLRVGDGGGLSRFFPLKRTCYRAAIRILLILLAIFVFFFSLSRILALVFKN